MYMALTQISNKIRWATARLKNKNIIVQFGPPRSGSTVIYNILREVFPKKTIKKRHRYSPKDSIWPIVVSYRHPLDCIASRIQCCNQSPTDEVLEEQIISFDESGIWDVLKIRNQANVLMLRYEDFVYDYNLIYDQIERHFRISISQEKRNAITSRYQIKAVEKLIGDKTSFDEYDPVTQLHGKHISKYKGKPYYYQTFFSAEQIEYLKTVYELYLNELNYTQ
ncbi:MAG: hypothetical protein P8Z79_01185 [Sedimentisphaerales bacterium]